ncbi:hypothetical protein TSMEX_005139 [Taenia solium]|eukprot:TsM_000912900 transcript=TsM_000912900 gene=TsM_000912900
MAAMVATIVRGGNALILDIRLPPLSDRLTIKMSRNIPHSNSRVGKKEEEEREDPSTLVAALADLPHFKDGMNFEDWMKTAKFHIHLYPRRQRIPLILRALPHELFPAAKNAGVTTDSDIDHYCEILTQLAIDQ